MVLLIPELRILTAYGTVRDKKVLPRYAAGGHIHN